MQLYTHEDRHFVGFFDPIKCILYVQYGEEITPTVTNQMYNWMNTVIAQTSYFHGAIFDFQQVKRFDKTNYTTAQRQSVQLNTKFDLRDVPTVLLVDTVYQEMTMRSQLSMSPQQERKKLGKNLEEGFAFITKFNEGKDVTAHYDPTDETILNTHGASAWYDQESCSVMVLYYGKVTGDTTADVYTTTAHILGRYGVNNVQGGVYDFRCISGFELENYRTVRSESANLNQNYDMSHIAVALIVRNVIQERLVRSTLKITPQEKRKKVVFSMSEARQFIISYKP